MFCRLFYEHVSQKNESVRVRTNELGVNRTENGVNGGPPFSLSLSLLPHFHHQRRNVGGRSWNSWPFISRKSGGESGLLLPNFVSQPRYKSSRFSPLISDRHFGEPVCHCASRSCYVDYHRRLSRSRGLNKLLIDLPWKKWKIHHRILEKQLSFSRKKFWSEKFEILWTSKKTRWIDLTRQFRSIVNYLPQFPSNDPNSREY